MAERYTDPALRPSPARNAPANLADEASACVCGQCTEGDRPNRRFHLGALTTNDRRDSPTKSGCHDGRVSAVHRLESMGPKTLDRLLYIDDSGHPASGLVVYGWIEFRPDRWHDVLGQWLSHRKRLWREFGIAVPQELHMMEYALGRGRISRRLPDRFVRPDGTELWKDFGGEAAQTSLSTLRSIEGLRVGAVYRQATRATWASARADAYRRLLAKLEDEMTGGPSLAMLFMDGDGSETSYREAHRALPRATRRVIEDPIYTDSKSSQLMQMADHVAWCANAAVAKVPKHAFAHGWYEQYLSVRGSHRCPLAI